ncbi:MAG: hypothetical protein KAH04_07610 [Psychrilyobacter sp.]|nr:hypothetical protein [Psychrilyobacter sp.]
MKRLTMLLTGILLVGTMAMGASSTGIHKEYDNFRGEEVEFTVDTNRMIDARVVNDREEMEEDGYMLVDHQVGETSASTVWYDVEDEEYVVMEVASIGNGNSTYIYAEGDTLEEIVEYVNGKSIKFDEHVKREMESQNKIKG